MSKNINKLLVLGLAVSSLSIVSCNKDKGKTYDNETTPLVFSTQDLDGVFNPFYNSTAPDGSIVGMTQLSMFTTDKNANLAYGKDEATLVLDFEEQYDKSVDQTTYKFVLKNPSMNVKYSNGSYVTLRDVLFNMYEYLDPQYTGSSTMYSTKIVGLNEYRTQEASEAAQKQFEKKFIEEANTRVDNLVTAIEEIKKANTNANLDDIVSGLNGKGGTFATDFKSFGEQFKKELNSDFDSNKGTYEEYGFDNDIQTFFYVEGLINIHQEKPKDDPTRIDYGGFDTETINNYEDGKPMTKETAIQIAYEHYFPDKFDVVANYTQSATTIREVFASEAKEEYFKKNTTRQYDHISGIKVITEDTTINGKNYSYSLYNSDGTTFKGSDNGYEMFSITINGVDPKAKWNFAFSVAPMYYYSNAEQIQKFNYGIAEGQTPYFGVEYGSRTFQTQTIKDPNKIGVPVGAGPYKASTSSGNDSNLSKGTFFSDNVVYFERNDNFLMGKPKIKYIKYKVVAQNQYVNALNNGEIHFCEPSAKPEIISELNDMKSKGISYVEADTLGYGYIGINPKFVKEIDARKALMSVMDVQLAVDYYSGHAKPINRPMSLVSWAYPKEAKPYYEFDATGETAKKYFKDAGYSPNSQGKMVNKKDGKQFKITFTIAGSETDHPAASTFFKAEKILEAIGCDVTVTPSVDALSKLNTGDLAVWAAAWGSTVDPDMYQVYHRDSTATSTYNWGYNVIKNDVNGTTYGTERSIIDNLSEKIEEGRSVLSNEDRIPIYAECLDLVMELAVELPTYQRSDLFAYNASLIDTSTMTPTNEVSPYNGPINKIWELSLKTK